MAPKYLGGKKRNNGRFGFMQNGKFCIGHNHVPMTKINRDRFLHYPQKGILVA